MPQPPKTLNSFESLLQVIKDLRGPEGCPWDKEQTHTSLTPYSIEEVYEMVEAIENGNDPHICEELGDVLFQVILHSAMAEERNTFNINDVIESITTKIVRRHPHVFSTTKVKDTAEVIKNWEEIKNLEKKNKDPNIIPNQDFFNIPTNMPALQRAHKIGEKTEKYKFDWSEPTQVLKHLKSEIAELEQAMNEKNKLHIQHEIGDVLFTAAQLARHLNSEPESDLREANRRFMSRFNKMISEKKSLKDFIDLSPEEKEKLWTLIKMNS